AQIYFLADRRMPTRFAMTQALWTGELRDEAYDSTLRDPRKLVVGKAKTLIGPRSARYLRLNYKRVWSAGKWTVFARRDKPRPPAPEKTPPLASTSRRASPIIPGGRRRGGPSAPGYSATSARATPWWTWARGARTSSTTSRPA